MQRVEVLKIRIHSLVFYMWNYISRKNKIIKKIASLMLKKQKN
jgi:hypothetical protein